MAFDWQSLVKTVAPGIATALGGPLAGVAVKTLADSVLGSSEGDQKTLETQISAALQADPNLVMKVKEAEIAFQQRMAELDVDVEKIHADDRADARKRETSGGIFAAAGLHVLAFAVLAIFAWSIHYVLTGELSMDRDRAMLVGAVIGYTSAKADQVVAYFFGSSRGSAEKTKHLADALSKRA